MSKKPIHKFVVIIPARYNSSRLPGKPLLNIGDKSLIGHVCQAALDSSASEVIVATDDDRIEQEVKNYDVKTVMTSLKCKSGTDRVAQAVSRLGYKDKQIIVNLQGDEPFIHSSMIDLVADTLHNEKKASIATLCEKIDNHEDFNNPNVVKVIKRCDDMALYFSRSAIPHYRDQSELAWKKFSALKHIGIYAYRSHYIKTFASRVQGELEQIEMLEQLRALQAGEQIIVKTVTQSIGLGVDTIEDLIKARQYYENKQK